MKPLPLAEVHDLVSNIEEKKALEDYLKKFTHLSSIKARKIADELRSLNNAKITEEHVIKIVDLLPRDAEDTHKIFHGVSLDEQETNAILDIVKNY